MTRVLIVDDSALMRRHLKEILEGAGFETRSARNGTEALEALEADPPDVITLDINMPEMDGLTCLARLMTVRPTPVVMVSSLTEKGAEATFEALALGAVDFIHKPEGTISLNVARIEREILDKVRAASRARIRRSLGLQGRRRAASLQGARKTERPVAQATLDPQSLGVVLVGVSTGGPGTLEDILPALPADFPWPVVVAQHMPGSFTTVFARRLDTLCALTVIEASSQMPLEPGTVYIAKGDADVVVGRRATRLVVNPMPSADQYPWHPSVGRLVESALHALPAERLVGVLLTGMGDDGAAAMTELRQRGGKTIAQDEESSVIFGMPGELVRRGGADVVLPASRIAGQLCGWLGLDKGVHHGTRQR